jgi:hypothetical protein
VLCTGFLPQGGAGSHESAQAPSGLAAGAGSPALAARLASGPWLAMASLPSGEVPGPGSKPKMLRCMLFAMYYCL